MFAGARDEADHVAMDDTTRTPATVHATVVPMHTRRSSNPALVAVPVTDSMTAAVDAYLRGKGAAYGAELAALVAEVEALEMCG